MQKKEVKILALDYDGVIADSLVECLAVGFNAYLKMHNGAAMFQNTPFTAKNFRKLIKNDKKSFNEYKKLRPYVVDAFCYYVMLYIIDNKIRINSQEEYNKARNSLMDSYKEYVKYFYNERYNLIKEDFDGWLGFIKPYRVIESIKKLRKSYILAIASNNKRKGIEGFLKKHEIPIKTIADSDISINKVKQIEFIKNKYEAEYSDIYFVDDQVGHFPALLKLGVKCFLAAWGYNNAEQRKKAKRIGAVSLREDNFYQVLGKINLD